MTDEIKEILDIFKQVDLETDVGGCSNCPRIKDKNRTCIGCLNNAKDKLLDYITNLQEKYEEADNDRHKLFEQKEKVIEYIKEYRKTSPKPMDIMVVKLIHDLGIILQGEDKE